MTGNTECLPLVELPTTYSLNSAFETLFPFKQGSWALEMARLTRSAFNLLGAESYGISGSATRRLAYTGTDHTLPVWRGIQAICEPLLQDREVIIPLDNSEYRALITMFSGPIDLDVNTTHTGNQNNDALLPGLRQEFKPIGSPIPVDAWKIVYSKQLTPNHNVFDKDTCYWEYRPTPQSKFGAPDLYPALVLSPMVKLSSRNAEITRLGLAIPHAPSYPLYMLDLVQRQDGLLIKDHRLGNHVSNKQNAVASATSDRQGDWQIMIEPEIISCLSRLSTIEQPSYLSLAQAFISGLRTVRNELQFPALHPPMDHASQNPRIELETILKYQAALVKVPCHGEFTDYDCQEIITEAILCLCFDRLNAVRLLHEMSLLEKFVPGLAQQ